MALKTIGPLKPFITHHPISEFQIHRVAAEHAVNVTAEHAVNVAAEHAVNEVVEYAHVSFLI